MSVSWIKGLITCHLIIFNCVRLVYLKVHCYLPHHGHPRYCSFAEFKWLKEHYRLKIITCARCDHAKALIYETPVICCSKVYCCVQADTRSVLMDNKTDGQQTLNQRCVIVFDCMSLCKAGHSTLMPQWHSVPLEGDQSACIVRTHFDQYCFK